MSSAELLSTSQRVAAFYPQGVGTSGTVDFPDDLVSKEQPPPLNPLLKLESEQMGAAGAMRAEPAAVLEAVAEAGRVGSDAAVSVLASAPCSHDDHVAACGSATFGSAVFARDDGRPEEEPSARSIPEAGQPR